MTVHRYVGDDPYSEYSTLRDRIKRALERIDVGTGVSLGDASGAEARALVNYVTGAEIPNGPLMHTMRLMAEACEAAADRVGTKT
jgi:hypothetical protein